MVFPMNGFFVSTIMNREDKGLREFYNTANKYVKIEKAHLSNTSDFEAALLSELKSMKIKQNFSVLEKHKSMVILKNETKMIPSDIVISMRTKKAEFENVQRVLPLDILVKFDESKISDYIRSKQITGTFKIQFEGRMCPSDLKNNLFKIIIPLIDNKVSLDEPDYTIIIQAFKSLIGISVVKSDKDNFNFSNKNTKEDNITEQL